MFLLAEVIYLVYDYVRRNIVFYSGHITFNMEKVSNGLGLSLEQTLDFFVDGRKFSYLAENIVSNFPTYEKAKSEKMPYDVIKNNLKIECRCMTDKIDFKPSSQIGAGRKFNEQLFKEHKIDQIDYFMIFDLNKNDLKNGKIGYWFICKNIIWDCYKNCLIGKNACISRNKFSRFLKEGIIKWEKEI